MANIKQSISIETRTVKVEGDYIREAKAMYDDGVYYCVLQTKPTLRYSAYRASYIDYLTGVTSDEPELIEEFPVYPDLEPLTEAYHALFSMPVCEEQKQEEILEEMEEYETPSTDDYEVNRIVSHTEDMFAPGFGIEQIEVEFKSKTTGKLLYCSCESMYCNMCIAETPISDNEDNTTIIDSCEGLDNAVESEYYEMYYKTYKELISQ
ncbi:MAG: hypothetical protein MJ220_02865 [Bacilli bacterium]|nr:hypothetical protein [Bacilli bacterium]